MSTVTISGVNKRFESKHSGNVVALDDISMEIQDRTFVVIVGPSGCGKSTLLRLVAGLDEPTEGEIRVDDRLVSGPGRDRGMVFQSYTLFPWLTVEKNVEFGPQIGGRNTAERREIAQQFIREVGLVGFDNAYPAQLSGGMQQRVALARALANDPEVLLMDEPFGALDSQTRALMQELLLRIWEQHSKTVLFITHDIEEALFLGDRVHVMTARPGKIKDTIDVPFKRPRSPDVLTSEPFVERRRYVMELIREETLKTIQRADQGRLEVGT